MQNNYFWSRITNLCGSQTSPVVLCMQTACVASELLVSIGPSPHLLFLHAKQRVLGQNNKSLWIPALICVYWMQNKDFWTRKTGLNWSQISSVVLSTRNSVLSTRRKSVYWFQPSPVELCMQNSDFRTRITSLCGSKAPTVVFACKTAHSGPE